jgi:hypothetical protein
VGQSERCSARARPRRGPSLPRRPVLPVRVPEVARAFPRPRRAARCSARREHLEPRAAVRTRYGPAVRSPSSGVRAFPRHPSPVRWSLGGAPAALKGATTLGRAAYWPSPPRRSYRRHPWPAAASSGCGPTPSQNSPSPSPLAPLEATPTACCPSRPKARRSGQPRQPPPLVAGVLARRSRSAPVRPTKSTPR